jgi:hypothetical protein
MASNTPLRSSGARTPSGCIATSIDCRRLVAHAHVHVIPFHGMVIRFSFCHRLQHNDAVAKVRSGHSAFDLAAVPPRGRVMMN